MQRTTWDIMQNDEIVGSGFGEYKKVGSGISDELRVINTEKVGEQIVADAIEAFTLSIWDENGVIVCEEKLRNQEDLKITGLKPGEYAAIITGNGIMGDILKKCFTVEEGETTNVNFGDVEIIGNEEAAYVGGEIVYNNSVLYIADRKIEAVYLD